MNIKKEKQGIFFLHKEIGTGQSPEGNKVRLIQTDCGVHMQVYPKDKKEANKGNWKTYTLTYQDLSEAFFKAIQKLESVQE